MYLKIDVYVCTHPLIHSTMLSRSHSLSNTQMCVGVQYILYTYTYICTCVCMYIFNTHIHIS